MAGPSGSGWPSTDDRAPPLVRNPRVGRRPYQEPGMFVPISAESGSMMLNALPMHEDAFDFKCVDRVVHALVHGDFSVLTPEEEERLTAWGPWT